MKGNIPRQSLIPVVLTLALAIMTGACGEDGMNPIEVERYEFGGTSYTLIMNGYASMGGERVSEIFLLDDAAMTALWTYDAGEIGGMNFGHSADIVGDEMLVSDTENDRVFIVEAANGIDTASPGFSVVWNSETDGNFDLDYVNDADFLTDGNLLLTDRDNHRIMDVDRATGEIDWQFGVTGQPGSNDTHLNGPHNGDRLDDGSTIVADSNNNRVLVIAEDGSVLWEYDPSGADALNWPRDADMLDDDHVLITDSRNGRVVEVNPAGVVVWEFTISVVGTQSQPYESDLLDNGNVLVSGPGINSTGSVFEVDYVTQDILWRYPE
ncbi:PQQ-binding-like beta-propeller repeat protein [Thermodesulfobacteriota bacterium]